MQRCEAALWLAEESGLRTQKEAIFSEIKKCHNGMLSKGACQLSVSSLGNLSQCVLAAWHLPLPLKPASG